MILDLRDLRVVRRDRPEGERAILRRAMSGIPDPDRPVADLLARKDRALVEQIAGGSQAAFADLFRQYGPAAFGLALRVLNQRALAEDVVQEVFLSIWRRAGAYDASRGSVRAWVLMQVHHRAVDVVRREEAERRRGTESPAPLADTPTTDDVVENQWIATRREQIRRALDVLPEEQRSVIELCYFNGLTQSQAAERLGTPLGTVKSRTLAAMKRLRTAVAPGVIE